MLKIECQWSLFKFSLHKNKLGAQLLLYLGFAIIIDNWNWTVTFNCNVHGQVSSCQESWILIFNSIENQLNQTYMHRNTE